MEKAIVLAFSAFGACLGIGLAALGGFDNVGRYGTSA